MCSQCSPRKFVAFVTSVTFAIDLSLQLVLVATVGRAVGGLGQVKDRSKLEI